MNQPPTFRKLPECDRCLFYTSAPQLCCAVHPEGAKADRCLDFREDTTAAHRWSQFLGLQWVSGEDLMDFALRYEHPFDD
ncbi:hypothetical protein H6F76_02660 [Leptolyngbya sp. FACHB-321]|uniref:hypothetical protein n=1 Tax=Leptolyngbya sp. FACHB-321 TaxID=2692807 RepID=UPI0016891C4C|nr:hypothetical protein [Leptolyngbya sp. FACHB-321]MBD2033951.1 hypothetical protein [Leptolyngbya sp. FACHB-321]